MTVTAPPGFENLTGPQQVLLDVYLNGTRVAEAMAIVEPGRFRFVDARTLVESLPGLLDRPRILAALEASDLDPHTEAVCPPDSAPSCLKPRVEVAAIVFDAARYRVDVLVNPGYLTVQEAVRLQNLPPPSDAPAMINFLSGTISSGSGQPTQYYLQNNAVVGVGTGRIRAILQQASYSGFQTDTLVGELDRPGLRYSAGAFWIPGNTLIDRVKLVGVGVSSQFNTRLDRDQLMGSPLVVFLDQRSRVDILVNGNIVSSLAYEAGNRALDTSMLPEGSYTVILRISTAGGAVREEQRFFSRSSLLPMMGHDAFFVYAGTQVRDNRGLLGDVSRTPLFQAGWARRLRPALSVNLGLIGTDRRQWLAAGATVLRGSWQLDAAVHVSNRGGLGFYGHLARTSTGRFSLDLDVRHISNPGGGPLLATTTLLLPGLGGLPYSPYAGAYTQLGGSLGYRIGDGRLALLGTYRRQEGRRRDYSLGPSLYMPLVRWRALAIDFNGTYAVTPLGRQGYAGLNLRLTNARTTYTATGGSQLASGRDGPGGVQAGVNVSRRFDDMMGAQLQADGGVEHANGLSYARAQLQAQSPLGAGNLNVVQPFADGSTQFAAALQTALVVGQGGVRFDAGRNGDAVVVVHVDAGQTNAADALFDVLVDNRVVGTIRGSGGVSFALPSYRAYGVRLRARGAVLTDYDASARQVSLYPGNVVRLKWSARPVMAVFGRLVRQDGTPLAHAEIAAGGDLAQTDEQGNFLIQTSQGATLTARTRDGLACSFTLDTIAPSGAYATVGDQLCRPAPPSSAKPVSLSRQPEASP